MPNDYIRMFFAQSEHVQLEHTINKRANESRTCWNVLRNKSFYHIQRGICLNWDLFPMRMESMRRHSFFSKNKANRIDISQKIKMQCDWM